MTRFKTVQVTLTLVIATDCPDQPLAAQYLEAAENLFFSRLNGLSVHEATVNACVYAPNAPETHVGYKLKDSSKTRRSKDDLEEGNSVSRRNANL